MFLFSSYNNKKSNLLNFAFVLLLICVCVCVILTLF